MRTFFWAKRKESAPIQLRVFNKLQQLIVVFFGLPRVSNNEVATKSCIGGERSNVVDALEKAFSITPSAHATQVRLTYML